MIPSGFAEAYQTGYRSPLSPDTPTIPSGFADAFQAENYSPPTSVFDGLQQHQYRTEVSTFSAALLVKPCSLTI